MKKAILLLLISYVGVAQPCPEVEQLFKLKDSSVLYSDKFVKFRLDVTDYYPLLKYPETKRLQQTIQSAQSHLDQAAQSILAKNYNQAKYSIKQADYQIQDAEFQCSSLSFVLWKREIKLYESFVTILEAVKTNKDTSKVSLKNRLESQGYKVTTDSTGLHATKTAKPTPSTTYSESTTTYYTTPKSARTKHVSGYYRNGRYVKSYYRAPRGYSSGRTSSKSRRRR